MQVLLLIGWVTQLSTPLVSLFTFLCCTTSALSVRLECTIPWLGIQVATGHSAVQIHAVRAASAATQVFAEHALSKDTPIGSAVISIVQVRQCYKSYH